MENILLEDILYEIFKNLNHKDIMQIMITSKVIHNICSSQILWKKVFYNNYNVLDFDIWLQKYTILPSPSTLVITMINYCIASNFCYKLMELKKVIKYNHSITGMYNLKNLSLKLCHIGTLPKFFERLENLTRLDLEYNDLSVIPSEIGLLYNLTYLSLGNNKLTILPFEIGDLYHLKKLYLYSNKLITLPPEIKRLRHLNTLYFENNEIISLPDVFESLTSLRHIKYDKYEINELPPSFEKLIESKYCY